MIFLNFRLDLKDGAVKNVCGGERDPTNLFAYGDQVAFNNSMQFFECYKQI